MAFTDLDTIAEMFSDYSNSVDRRDLYIHAFRNVGTGPEHTAYMQQYRAVNHAFRSRELAKQLERNRRPETRAYQAEWVRAKRKDPAHREAERARNRERMRRVRAA